MHCVAIVNYYYVDYSIQCEMFAYLAPLRSIINHSVLSVSTYILTLCAVVFTNTKVSAHIAL